MDHATIARFDAYYRAHPAWGSLHLVLDDLNLEDEHIAFCERYATEQGDAEGAELARVLRGWTEEQILGMRDLVTGSWVDDVKAILDGTDEEE